MWPSLEVQASQSGASFRCRESLPSSGQLENMDWTLDWTRLITRGQLLTQDYLAPFLFNLR